MPFHIDHICSVTYLMYIIRYIYIYILCPGHLPQGRSPTWCRRRIWRRRRNELFFGWKNGGFGGFTIIMLVDLLTGIWTIWLI